MCRSLQKNEQGLRFGYTTGSCAAAAAAAATQMLLTGEAVSVVHLLTPKGMELSLDIVDVAITMEEAASPGRNEKKKKRVRCAVQKDAGDDPDITDGILIYAAAECDREPGVHIAGGIGVGIVTRPGLDQPVGEAAINRVPREMITQEVHKILQRIDYQGGIRITIEIPEGEELAKKTFNPRLGIEGGLSVLGTSGIVEPMSEAALKETIRTELSVRRAEGYTDVVLVPGNYGLDFLRKDTKRGVDVNAAVKCSNFIGDAIDMAAAMGFTQMLLVGHIGKLIKLSGGIFHTHSRQADARIDLLVSAGVRAGVPGEWLRQLFDAVTTEDALAMLESRQVREQVMEVVKERISYYVRQRAGDRLQIQVILFSNRYGEL